MKKITLGLTLASLILVITSCNSGGARADAEPQNYQEKVMSVQEIENSQPANFLSAGGTYNESFFGDKLKVHGVIKNSATVATYKDAIVRITYYSKTKTELTSRQYTIYDFFPPHSEKHFELKIENYKDVSSIGWDVLEAKAE